MRWIVDIDPGPRRVASGLISKHYEKKPNLKSSTAPANLCIHVERLEYIPACQFITDLRRHDTAEQLPCLALLHMR